MSKKRLVPFIRQKAAALDVVSLLFANTNVQRRATREAMVEIKELAESFIAALDDDEAAGVKDDSESP